MQPKMISSRFKNQGIPQANLTPVIKIWSVTPTTQTVVVAGDVMSEIGDGFYKYTFVAYDPNLNYLFSIDGGTSLSAIDRFQEGANDHFADDIAYTTLEESISDHLNTDTLGLKLNQIHSDTQQLRLDVNDLENLLNILLKYERNRTKIDKVNKTLTVYDNDGVTPYHIFNLLDSTLNPSVTEVCERVPV